MNDTEKLLLRTRDTPLGKALLDYLIQRGSFPEVVYGERENPFATAEFSAYGKDVPRNGRITLGNHAGVGSMVHELTHAAEGNLYKQYLEGGRNRNTRLPQFERAYEKLMHGNSYFTKQGANYGTTFLANKLDPKWAKEEGGYRASRDELTAFGAGNQFSHSPWSGPSHLDSTLATELSIMLDLASRKPQQQKNPLGFLFGQ